MGGKSGGGSTTVVQSGSQSSTVEPTAEERRLNKLRLRREEFLDPQIRQTESSGLTLANQLLTGGELPGQLSPLFRGISPEITSDIARKSVADIQPFFQSSGLLDSGVNAEISARVAGDVRQQAETFNLNLLTQLLNLGLGGQAQVQQPILGFGSLLSQSLAGLRSQSGTFSGTSTTTTAPQRSKSFFGLF